MSLVNLSKNAQIPKHYNVTINLKHGMQEATYE